MTDNTNSNEIWKDIKGYEGLYQVSNLGNVKSFPRNGTIKQERILKQKYYVLIKELGMKLVMKLRLKLKKIWLILTKKVLLNLLHLKIFKILVKKKNQRKFLEKRRNKIWH